MTTARNQGRDLHRDRVVLEAADEGRAGEDPEGGPDEHREDEPRPLRDPEDLHRRVVGVAAQHEEDAVGEVEHPAHAEDHGEPDRDQGVEPAQGEPLEEDVGHRRSPGPAADRRGPERGGRASRISRIGRPGRGRAGGAGPARRSRQAPRVGRAGAGRVRGPASAPGPGGDPPRAAGAAPPTGPKAAPRTRRSRTSAGTPPWRTRPCTTGSPPWTARRRRRAGSGRT